MVLEHGGRRTGFSRLTTHSGKHTAVTAQIARINVLFVRGSGAAQSERPYPRDLKARCGFGMQRQSNRILPAYDTFGELR